MIRIGSDSSMRLKPLPHRRSSLVTVLDVGSTKVACLIARLKPRFDGDILDGRTHAIEVLGYGYQRARGIKSGVVVDLDAAEQAIRLAVDSAERMAGVTVESLIVTVTCGRLSSATYSSVVDVSSGTVAEGDIRRVLAAGGGHAVDDGRTIVHTLPVGYTLDGSRGIQDPRGMLGRRLGIDLTVVTAETAPLRNLLLSVGRGHLDVEAVVATPYASGLSTLVDDEAELGCACVDIGGGTTSIAVFNNKHLVHVDAIAIGGAHVTLDIANGLSIRVQDAERLKTLHGTALAGSSDERDVLTVHPVGEEDAGSAHQVPRAHLNRIIRPRVDEILELVRDRLAASGFAGRIGRRVVLTGGGSLLTGLPEVARRVLGRSVRLGRPLGVAGLPEAAKGPAFAAVVGLIVYPQVVQYEQVPVRPVRSALTGTDGYLARVGRWFKDGF
ncbi:cell division protein FtsA [Pseudoxanthobacter soli DSM 19599]|uniref:Cell division protein FtsA n=1 Tax=Pseudoxanthobacter soli DSM 19599 TaxID=1123029 RepID=A0A1M7ZEF5_9HYPH|nr:cell division protein FtsA [Pseudoxanthobacter soli]SHO63066.1 cell division protein FtsA [Pseudoxanthobacter soli DSM 19599]